MNISPNVNLERIEEADLRLQFQLSKCLNGGENLEELAGYITSDMCSLSVNSEKCAILRETVNQIRQIKLAEDCSSSDDLQKSEVSSSNPHLLSSDLIAPLLLHICENALDGFLFVVNTDGKIEFVSANVQSFLKYNHEDLINKSIYNIIHVGDHASFSTSLLPMSIGNGFAWSEPNEPNTKSRSFGCRFLIRPPEDKEETMEEKQMRISQYKNMQISAVLVPYGSKTEGNDLDNDVQNRLVCVAKCLPSNEKSSTEQFLTRLDLRGKITSVEISGLSPVYSQYLNKELVGCSIQELCHPEDYQKLCQHLKDTLQQGSNTSGAYRFKLSQEKIVYVQTKSKRLNLNPMASDQDMILAQHTIIRDSDPCIENNVIIAQRSDPSPVNVMLQSLGSNGTAATMNGGAFFASLSPQDFNLNDIADMFPAEHLYEASNNNGGSVQPSEDGTFSPELAAVSQPSPSLEHLFSTVQNKAPTPQPRTKFSPEMHRSSPTASASTNSPGRAATPFTSSGFPFSPARSGSPAVVKREEAETPGSPASAKLRNLLTHGGSEEADSSSMEPRSEEPMENGYGDPGSSNIMLRELLNQADEEMGGDEGKSLSCDSNCNVVAGGLGNDVDGLPNRTMNNNNMLRKLLNNGEEKSFKKNEEQLIHQLLKTEGKVSVDVNSMSHSPGASPRMPSAGLENQSVAKRKSPDTPTEDSIPKRPSQQNPQHAHLAGQNPMLASMLAQTPRTAPTVPTSVATAILSALPQERLPKNLEKKLVHTPYTGASVTGSTAGVQYTYTQAQVNTRLLSTSLQQEVVTADTRGHVTLAPQSAFPNSTFGNSASLQFGNFTNNAQSQVLSNSTASIILDGLMEASKDPNNTVNASDPDLSDILDQVWSMEQDLNFETTPQPQQPPPPQPTPEPPVSDEMALIKLLEEMPEPVVSAPKSTSPGQNAKDKMAIETIQRQLMSFEAMSKNCNTGGMNPRANSAVRFQQPVLQNNFQQYQNPPAYGVQRPRPPMMQQQQQNSLNLNMQQMIQRQGLQQQQQQQFGSMNSDMQNRRQLEQKQKFLQQKRLLMQQQKQQMAMANRQPLPDNLANMQTNAAGPFSDNMNDLMNSAVAPNVTLQRSSSMPEPQLSPRYGNIQPGSPSSQLSPGQRPQPQFSPLTQGSYPQATNYTQQQWLQRGQLQQQNPMLNAQLSQQQQFNNQQQRFTLQQQQRQQMAMNSIPSPSRNSPFNTQPDSPFHPPSPGVALYQQNQQAQPRLQRAVSIPNRVNSPRGMPSGYAGNDPILSPQPSPGSYTSQSSNFSTSMPVSTPNSYLDNFNSFDQQVYAPAMMDRNRGNNGAIRSSDFVRQELRAKVGARTQQQVHPQLVQQSMSPAAQSSSQSLSQADLDALGLAFELADGQPTSPALYPSLLSTNSNENQSGTGSPRFQIDEQRPAEQKKSLLQQLLSEPP